MATKTRHIHTQDYVAVASNLNFICLVSAPGVAPTNLSAGAIVGIVLACIIALSVEVFYLL